MQTNDDGLTVVRDPEAKAHKCHTLEVLSDRFDRLETRTDALQVEVSSEIHKLSLRLAVVYALTTIILYKVLGVAVGELGWCF